MKVANYIFENIYELEQFVRSKKFKDEANLLVQFFDGRDNASEFSQVIGRLSMLLPLAVIIGATTAGEIINGQMSDKKAVLSFAVFESTRLIPLYTCNCEFEGGIEIAKQIHKDSIKAAIFFSEGINGRPEAFLMGVSSVKKELIIAGGAAADNGYFSKTLISVNGEVYDKGVVGVAFDNKSLHVENSWKLGWNKIGRPLHITKVSNNRVYEIDSKPIFEVIEHYLGKEAAKTLPSSMTEFPLIKIENGVSIARAPVAALDDSLVFAGCFEEGDTVYFSVADIDSLADRSENQAVLTRPEAIWIYSCMGRKSFAGKILENEFEYFSSIAPTSGFFTYGEFFKTTSTTRMLNLTTTTLALSESLTQETAKKPSYIDIKHKHSNIAAMANLTNAIVSDLEQNIKLLYGYRLVLDSNSIVSKTDKNGIITYVNDLFVKVSGYSRDELLGKPHSIIRHPDTPSYIFEDLWRTIKSGKTWKYTIKNRAKSGEAYYVDSSIVPLFDDKGEIIEYIAARNDLTKIIKQQQIITSQKTDSLTGLPNRLAFFDELSKSITPILAIINIDDFSEINRFYGFDGGDKLLQEFANELLSLTAQKNYVLYKFNADCFGLCVDAVNLNDFCEDIEAIIKQIQKTIFLAEVQETKVRVTAGIAYEKEQIVSKAEDALKAAHKKHLNMWIHSREDSELKNRNFEMLKVINRAIQDDLITPFYQAIVDTKTNNITKYESLMRIVDDNGRVYSPYLFLDIAKKSRYYQVMTYKMLEKTLIDFSDRKEDVSINLSVEDIENEDTVEFIKKAVANFSDPKRIIFELTETEAVEDYEKIIKFIKDIKECGSKISIDDFGSGYSNFAYLAKFKPDFIKIDGSIIKEILKSADLHQVVAAISDFSRRLGAKTVAEFVSSKELDDEIRKLDIDFGQGYYYAEPKPLGALE